MLSASGCRPKQVDEDTDTQPSPSIVSKLPIYRPIIKTDNVITAHYNNEAGFNPFTVDDSTNFALSSLMYEGLFALDRSFDAQPVLCESCTTEDGLEYEIKIKENIAMSDGSTLDAADVVYSLDWARTSTRFSSRMETVSYVAQTGQYTLVVYTTTENYKLEEILDIPIIKYGYIDSWCPPGTGPYYYSSSGPCFEKSTDYRDEANVTVETIYLKEFDDLEIIESFSSGELDLVWEDPCGNTLNLRQGHDEYVYTTTTLQYVGFNGSTQVLSNPAVRSAIGHAIDRNTIIRQTGSRGLAAPLIFPSNHNQYDKELEISLLAPDGTRAAKEQLAALGFEDVDKDGILEYQSGGKINDFSISFLVCSENELKIKAAEVIIASLQNLGIKVTIKSLPYQEYLAALQNGAFDMYYAETTIPTNFDFTDLLCSSLNYGGINNDSVRVLTETYFKSKTPVTEKQAVSAICKYVAENAPIIPIFYRQCFVHTYGASFGFGPTQSGFFATSPIGKNLAEAVDPDSAEVSPTPSNNDKNPSPLPSPSPSPSPTDNDAEEPSPSPEEPDEPEYTDPDEPEYTEPEPSPSDEPEYTEPPGDDEPNTGDSGSEPEPSVSDDGE